MTARTTIKSEIRSINPELARHLLSTSQGNRNISRNLIVRLLTQMKAGDWLSPADPIKLDRNGHLLDGHHRLNAVILYGRPIRFLVLSGYDPEVFRVLDTGIVRTAASSFEIENIPHSRLCMAIARQAILWDRGVHPPLPWYGSRRDPIAKSESKGRPPTDPEIVAFVESDRSVIEAAEIVNPGAMARLGPKSALGMAYYLFQRIDRTAAKGFFEDLRQGVALSSTDPVLVLRERLLKAKEEKMKSHQRIRQSNVLAWCIKAWNASRKEKPLPKMTYQPGREQFPDPI